MKFVRGRFSTFVVPGALRHPSSAKHDRRPLLCVRVFRTGKLFRRLASPDWLAGYGDKPCGDPRWQHSESCVRRQLVQSARTRVPLQLALIRLGFDTVLTHRKTENPARAIDSTRWCMSPRHSLVQYRHDQPLGRRPRARDVHPVDFNSGMALQRVRHFSISMYVSIATRILNLGDLDSTDNRVIAGPSKLWVAARSRVSVSGGTLRLGSSERIARTDLMVLLSWPVSNAA